MFLFAAIAIVVSIAWLILLATGSDRIGSATLLLSGVITGSTTLAVRAHNPETEP